MGTALTEGHLRELGRLTRRLLLCFDADAAGQDATVRGMEIAAGRGFDVRIVTLPRGLDPADAPEGFEERLATAESYLVYRVRLELDRAPDRQAAFVRILEVLSKVEDSPEFQEARRLASDRLDLPKETLGRLLPARTQRPTQESQSPRLLETGDRLERDVLAACVAHASLVPMLGELTPEHFDSELNRRFRHALVSGRGDADLTSLRAELDAHAAQQAINERTGAELLLQLRERKLRKDLAGADLARTTELQAHLAKVRQALAELR
jgi:DNA primase